MQQYAHTTPAGPAPSSCFMDCELKRIIWRVPGQIWAGILGLQTPLPAMLKWGRLAELFIRSANLRRARASISPLGGARALPPPPFSPFPPPHFFHWKWTEKGGVQVQRRQAQSPLGKPGKTWRDSRSPPFSWILAPTWYTLPLQAWVRWEGSQRVPRGFPEDFQRISRGFPEDLV